MYANAGGVTVSYFEWLKNLAHIRFGRLERRHDEASGRRMLKAIESVDGTRVHRRTARRASSLASTSSRSSIPGSRRP